MRKIREILLTEYIGAILVAVLVADAFIALIATAVAQVAYYVQFGHVTVLNAHGLSTTYSMLDALAKAVIYLVAAYLIARWLYPTKAAESPAPAQSGEGT
ncbi:MAG TPA: hypothetical protein VKA07_10015 [Candidatus Sulfotelmatobacter sp.]|nr:hypothetical protein [Candidatus Sulfotelmatobacter sp.]